MRDRLIRHLIRDEGLRLKPYKDTVGKLSIGIGRNLDDVGISEGEAIAMLENDIDRAEEGLDRNLPWWRGLDGVRQEVLVNLTFNLGITGLLGFKNTLAAMRDGLWSSAASRMLASKWARQVGKRAERLAKAMETGSFDESA